MPKFNKPTPSKINTIWATNAVTGDVTEIDTSKIQQGWIQEKPPYESENWINQQHDQYIAYINQLGIPEWDQYTEYQAEKSYVQGSNNIVYKCIQTHVNKNPATAGNEAFWNVWEGNRQATTTSRGTVELATNNETSQGQSTTLAVTPASILNGLLGTGLLQNNGYVKIPVNVSGAKKELIVQFGSVSITGGSTSATWTFPIKFPTQVFVVNPTRISTTGPDANDILSASIDNLSQSVIEAVASEPSTRSYRILAVGY